MPRKSIGASMMPQRHQRLVDQALRCRAAAAARRRAGSRSPSRARSAPASAAAPSAPCRPAPCSRPADSRWQKLRTVTADRRHDGEDEGRHVGGVPVAARVGSTKNDLYCSSVRKSFGPPRFSGGSFGWKLSCHHVEIGQHDQEQRPEGHQRDEDDAEHRAVALEEALARRIVAEPSPRSATSPRRRR